MGSWPNAPTTGFFDGHIDDVAVYKHALTPSDIAEHVAAAGAPSPNQLPDAALNGAVTGMQLNLDGSVSKDGDGTIASYTWKWGDGESSTGPSATASHSYAVPGRYDVTLKVTDDAGGTDVVTKRFRVPVNTAPVTPNLVVETPMNTEINPLELTGAGDPDALEGDPAVSISTTNGVNGGRVRTVFGSTARRYTPPNATFVGRDTFTYTMTDADGAKSTGTVVVRVYDPAVGPNQAPVAGTSTARTTANRAVSVSLPFTDAGDPGPHTATFTDLNGAKVSGLGTTVTYTPRANWKGTTSFGFTVTDELGQSASGTVTVVIAKAPAKVTGVKAAPKRIKPSTRGKVTFRVVANGKAASGVAQVRKGAKVLGKVRLTATGTGAVKLPRLAKGKHALTVVYLGNAYTTTARATLTIRVRR
jgi:hypothetical protein